jgi:ATP-dependent Clp protease ATP-binding subunit ClpA
MANLSLFERIVEFKNKLSGFLSHKKKLKALQNYSQVVHFVHDDYLTLIDRCMSDGFLGDKESDFLDYMLDRYEVNFLDWHHKTKWIKSEMKRLTRENFQQREEPFQEKQLTFFDWKPAAFNVPTHIIAQAQKSQTVSRRI